MVAVTTTPLSLALTMLLAGVVVAVGVEGAIATHSSAESYLESI